MNQTIYIIGTDHRYQRMSSEFTAAQHRGFFKIISNTVDMYSIQIISEENNNEALVEHDTPKSSIQLVAEKMNKQHIFTEANREYRAKNGMDQENNIRISGLINNLSEEDIAASIEKSYREREQYWLKIILEVNVWPVLHICGANHADEFTKLVHTRGLNAVLLHADWGS